MVEPVRHQSAMAEKEIVYFATAIIEYISGWGNHDLKSANKSLKLNSVVPLESNHGCNL